MISPLLTTAGISSRTGAATAGVLLFGLTALGLWLPATPAGGADGGTAGWYSIEAIVFQRLSGSAHDGGERLTRTDRRSFPRNLRSFASETAGTGYRLNTLARATLEYPTLSFACPPPGGPAAFRPTSVPAWYRTGFPVAGQQPEDSTLGTAIPSPHGADQRRAALPPATRTAPDSSNGGTAGQADRPAPDDYLGETASFTGPLAPFCTPETPSGASAASSSGIACVPAPLDVPLPPARSAPVCGEAPGRPAPAIAPMLEPHPLLDRLRAIRDYRDGLLEASYRASTRGARLSRQARRLYNAPEMRLLWHGRWTQRVPRRSAPEPLLIQAGREWRDGHELEGTFDITRGRFLHFHARLWLRTDERPGGAGGTNAEPGSGPGEGPPAEAGANLPGEANARPYMALEESRPMRAATLHYLDHPRFGVLVRADPLPAPDWLADRAAAALPAERGN